MSADTDTQNARPKWMDILDAINAAGVNHAPKTQQSQVAPKPESVPMQQQAQQTEPETPQQKPSANEYQIGKYTFNPYTHTLIGPNGTVRIRPQYSNILNALCQNMGEEVELAKMFDISDDRKMRTAISMMRKLFVDDPSVKIQYYGGVVKYGGKGKLVVNQEGLNESEEPYEAIDYFSDFVDVLEQCGWAYYSFQDVQSKSTGKTGTRFSLDKYNTNACTADELKERILQTIPQQYVVFGNAQHRYAPELNRMTVVILDATEAKLFEATRNVKRIRITSLSDMGRNKEHIMNDILKLRHARNVGDEENVNHYVLGTLERYPNFIKFEIVE